MTVSYSRLVANGSSFGCFGSILRKWKGSVYKLVWRELIVYMLLYFVINMAYRYALTEPQQRIFEQVRAYFRSKSQSIPMSFVLGFYVTLVVRRWWEQYRLLPWPDTLALFVSAAIPGADERGRLMRRTIVRYAVLAYIITLKHVSVRVKKRFPSLQHIVDAGFMVESEKKIVEMMDARHPMAKYWMPLVWATNVINRARKDSLITSDQLVQTLLVELSEIRRRLGAVISYDTVCVPLVYTQVVTLSVYAYFLAALIGAQMIPLPEESALKKSDDIDLYFPVVTVLEFGFYIGWLKVAEVLIGPFGEDDDDIELNWLIDRHIKAAYMIVDEMHEEHPELLKDQYWDEVVPKDLPYTVGSEHYRREEPKGSADSYKVKDSDALYANISSRRKSALPDDMYADYESVDTPVVERRKNWFQKQISRMGSIRSSSTTYSSTGQIRPTRRNSMYSTAETMVAGSGVNIPGSITIPTGQSTKQDSNATYSNHKMSLYDRLAGRRSARAVKIKSGANKMNGSVPTTLKNRPRIPTPDVSKESNENIRLNHTMNGTHHQNLGSNANYPSEFPVVQVLLSPIQELEGLPTSSSAGALSAASGTTALAQAVLPPTLQSVGLNSMPAVTMAVNPVALGTVSLGQPLSLSQKLFSTMARSSATGRVTPTTGVTPVILTDITHAPSEKDDTSGNCTGSDISNASSATEEVSSGRNVNLPQKRGEVYV